MGPYLWIYRQFLWIRLDLWPFRAAPTCVRNLLFMRVRPAAADLSIWGLGIYKDLEKENESDIKLMSNLISSFWGLGYLSLVKVYK